MLLFKLLVLAHFVADFPLQSAAVYRMKLRSARGQLPHAAVCLAVCAIAGFPLLDTASYWAFITALAGCHLAIDLMKVKYLDHRAGGDNLWTFLLDQTLHLTATAAVLLTNLPSQAGPGWQWLEKLDGAGVVDVAIFFFAGVFGGVYLLNCIKKTLLGMPEGELARDAYSKYYGVAERALLFALIVAGKYWLGLVPLVVAFRLPAANRCAKKFQPRSFLLSLPDIAGNVAIACAAGIAALLALRSRS
jgi:hypothetical protein